MHEDDDEQEDGRMYWGSRRTEPFARPVADELPGGWAVIYPLEKPGS